MNAKDKRIKITSEIFNLIKFIKINAYELIFFSRLVNLIN
jgi:hypothetical protein